VDYLDHLLFVDHLDHLFFCRSFAFCGSFGSFAFCGSFAIQAARTKIKLARTAQPGAGCIKK
jgi:hypothetical protein